MRKLPKSYGPFVYGLIQSGVTTAVASAIATFGALGLSTAAAAAWLVAWLAAWCTMIPLVILIAPTIQRIVRAVTDVSPPPAHGSSS